MTLYKNENGKNILMTAEEETKFLADQKTIQDKEKADKDIIETNETKKTSGKQKLKDLGLDDDEIKALMGA
jgi:hypothetical protein